MNKSYNTKFELFLMEQDTSKSIGGSYKVLFIVGGPGSGKDYVIRNIMEDTNLLEFSSHRVNSYLTGNDDILLQEAMKKGLGIIVNSNGDSLTLTRNLKRFFEGVGYESSMIHVYVDNETSKNRNQQRKRMISEDTRMDNWKFVNGLRGWHSRLFKNYTEINNSDTHNEVDLLVDYIKSNLQESVSINITGDTSEEVLEVLGKLSKPQPVDPKNYQSDDPHAFLTLGKTMQVTGEKVEVKDYLCESFRSRINDILESIDCGIEPGMSMASSGENLMRGTDKKPNKKGTFEVSEDTFGDEITNSITSKKEDELKKANINIPSVAVKNGSI